MLHVCSGQNGCLGSGFTSLAGPERVELKRLTSTPPSHVFATGGVPLLVSHKSSEKVVDMSAGRHRRERTTGAYHSVLKKNYHWYDGIKNSIQPAYMFRVMYGCREEHAQQPTNDSLRRYS